jgi:GNAT superfamily N-acetyltransferase
MQNVEPLSPDTWEKFETLFGRMQGANGGCWCMWWRLSRSDWYALTKDERRLALKAIVNAGESTGILLLEDDEPVGWCAVSPRDVLPTLNRSPVAKPIDDKPSWVISCFFVKAGWRGQGLMEPLIRGAVEFARQQGAKVIDAFPRRPKAARVIWTLLSG